MRHKIVFLILLITAGTPVHGAEYRSSIYDNSKSYVYFYRPCLAWDFANYIQVFDERGNIGKLNCSTYFVDQVDPGRHNYFAHGLNGQADDSLTLYMDPGKKYFVKTDFGLWHRPSLELTKRINLDKTTQFTQVPSATYHQYYAIITKEYLRKRFTYGDVLFDWMIKSGYLGRISRTQGRVWNNVDLDELKNDLEGQSPDEGDRLVNSIKTALYNVYVRKQFYDTFSAMDILKNCNVKIEFDVAVNGEISNIKLVPQTRGIPDDFLEIVKDLVTHLSPLQPLPEQYVQYHNGVFTKDLFEDTFSNGDAIFDWLRVNGYLRKISETKYHPIVVTGTLKANLIKHYPSQSEKILDVLQNYPQNRPFNIVVNFKHN